MKKLIYLFFCTLSLSCLEMPETSNITDSMTDLSVSSDFSWKSTTDVTVNIHNATVGIILISSEDSTQSYYKGYNDGSNAVFSVNINVPSYIKNIIVNDQTFEISNNGLNVISQDIYLSTSAKAQKVVAQNNSLHLNGSTDWVYIPNSGNIKFPNTFTLEAWVKAERQQTAKIIEKGDWDGFSIGQDLYKGWQTSVCSDVMTGTTLNWGSGQPILNKWYHLAATFNGGNLKLYVDGALVNSSIAIFNINNTGRTISIGSDNGSQKFFKGYMDNISIWTTELSATDITNSITKGLTGTEDGLIGLWGFNEGTGSVVYNSVSSLYYGNLIGSFSTDVVYGIDSDGDGVLDNYDDFSTDATRAFVNYYPSTNYGTLAFEDLWPASGDFDFNDLVVDYNFKNITNNKNYLVETYATFVVRAAGASKKNGFGFQLLGNIPESAMTVSGSSLSDSYISLGSKGWEMNQNKPTCIVFDNSMSELKHPGSGIGVNTSKDANKVTPDTISIHITYTTNKYTLDDQAISKFNPFMIINQERGKEVHLVDYTPTNLVDKSYFGQYQDASDVDSGEYYRSINNLPWAININEKFDYPYEKVDILKAYLKMQQWATSKGTLYPDWYKNTGGYRNDTNIYK